MNDEDGSQIKAPLVEDAFVRSDQYKKTEPRDHAKTGHSLNHLNSSGVSSNECNVDRTGESKVKSEISVKTSMKSMRGTTKQPRLAWGQSFSTDEWYNIPSLFSRTGPSRSTLGSSMRFPTPKTSLTPGPASYASSRVTVTRESSPAFSFAAYQFSEGDRGVQVATKKLWTTAPPSATRKQVGRLDHLPQGNGYSGWYTLPSTFDQAARITTTATATFGTSPRFSTKFAVDLSPGPGSYIKVLSPRESGQTALQKTTYNCSSEQRNLDLYGFGRAVDASYTIGSIFDKAAAKKHGPTYSFGTSPRFENRADFFSPGPGTYAGANLTSPRIVSESSPKYSFGGTPFDS